MAVGSAPLREANGPLREARGSPREAGCAPLKAGVLPDWLPELPGRVLPFGTKAGLLLGGFACLVSFHLRGQA